MKEQLKIATDATQQQVSEIIGAEGFLSVLPGGFLWWFESLTARVEAMEKLSTHLPGCVLEPLDSIVEVVETDKAVIDAEPEPEPEPETVEPEPENE